MKYLLLILSLSLPVATIAETATVAVASNFVQTMKQLVSRYEKQSGHKIKISSGSTGKLYAQILHGAPYDLYLAADQIRPEKLRQKKYGKRTLTYATGELMLCSHDAEREVSLKALKEMQFQHLAIANPKIAPYGEAAIEVLVKYDLVDQLRERLINGENIAQTYQFMVTGNAEYAMVARAQLIRTQQNHCWKIPSQDYSPIRQNALLLLRGEKNKAATGLFSYLMSSDAQALIEASGYSVAYNGLVK